ncbi:hypothetical protein HOC13_03825 [Candidatus Woesearchaeota archaeon]|jgi:hypothetical protein|nr:hypothetical protein [Candidatus Woesearchaeota archaeon]MBT6774623.1 hypothetical protein [Candidatus Woesearchaeota archaeon]
MSYKEILKQIPEDATVGITRRVPAFVYMNHVVEKLAVRELGYENGVMPYFNSEGKKFLENLELSTVVEKLEETANIEIHPKYWNFSDSEAAYASRIESKARAHGLLRMLGEK